MTSRYITLIDENEQTKITAPLESAWTLPPAAYTDAELFDQEAEHLFMKDWMCVAREEQVADPGDYLCVDLPQMPLVISRDLGGELHALSRVCVHRAMPVVDGSGSATRFVCPYHKWTYELDGRLRSAPMMQGAEGFSTNDCRLPEIQLEVWNGFVFVNADASAAPLSTQLTGLATNIKNYHFASLRIAETLYFPSPWNWKILVENFMEAYHHIGTHKSSLEPIYPARETTVPDNFGEPWAFLDMPGVDAPDSHATSFPDLTDAERQRLFAAVIFPSFLFAASNEYGVWYQLKPNSHDDMDLYIHLLLRPEYAETLSPDEMIAMRGAVSTVHEEDILANQGPWLGLNGRLTTQGRLSPFEKAIWQLNQHWVKRMAAPS